MQVRDKLFLSTLILATGVSGAMWFRKSPEERAAASPDPERRTVLREEFRPNPPLAALPKPSSPPLTPVPLKDPEATIKQPVANSDGSSPLPSMPPRFSSAWGAETAPAKGGEPAKPESNPPFAAAASSPSPGSPARFGPIPTPSAPLVTLPKNGFTASVEQPITHTVVDGDTLTHLAERYLGNAGRKMELFEANRDVLRDPDVLPLGLELRIPNAR